MAARTVELNTAVAVSGGSAHAATRPDQVDFESGVAVALPDNWRRTRAEGHLVTWYAISLDAAIQVLPRSRRDLVVVVPRAADRASFWLNGERLETGSGSGATRNRTLWLALPESALRPQSNTLQVMVTGSSEARDGLSAVDIGHASDLRFGYELRRFFQNTTAQMQLIVIVVALFASVPLWLKTRRAVHGLFIVLCLCWLPRSLLVMNPNAAAPSSAGLLFFLLTSLIAGMMVALLVLEYAQAKSSFWQRYRRALWVCVGLSFGLGLALAIGWHLTAFVVSVLHWPYYVMMMVPLFAQIRAAFLVPKLVQIVTAGALTFWAVAVGHDFAQVADLVDFDSFFWSPTATLLMLLLLIWRTVQDMAVARASTDHEVRKAVTQVSSAYGQELQQLHVEFDRIKHEERQIAISEERTRLLHDLHDGMGSQLITALRMTRRDDVPRGEVARVIEDSLDDMRLIIDSLDVQDRDLLPLLGNLRYRLEPRLNAVGMALVWDVEPLPELEYLSPETALAIVRIVQEAVNNAMRHSGADTITVSVSFTQSAIELCVADNGRGFLQTDEPSPNTVHRGLTAMRARSEKLGGTLRIASDPDGTRVTLSLPHRR